jgi:hypothetical protein
MKELPAEEWITTDNKLNVKLRKRKAELLFRVVNLAGIAGPEHRIIIDME